jgi:hypothetical protein
MTPKVPARLFVLLARDAHVGVILRRGPSDWVEMIQWHTKNDTFREGQWFHGRIFEHRCDLSANGKFFVYRAFKPGNRLKNPDYGDSWTAVSSPPNFTAQALWVHWNGTGGGGFFLKDGRMLLNHLDDNRKLHPAYRLPKGLEVKTIETYEDETTYMFNDIHHHAMLRDGWKPTEAFKYKTYLPVFYGGVTESPALILEKRKNDLTLLCRIVNQIRFHTRSGIDRHVMTKNWAKSFKTSFNHSTVSYTYRYALKNGDTELELDGVTWADFDNNKRLVIAKAGKLFSGTVDNGQLTLTELADFSEPHPNKNRS